MNKCHAAEFLLIFSDEIVLGKTEGNLKKIIGSNSTLSYVNEEDEPGKINYEGSEFRIEIKKNESHVAKYRSYTIKTTLPKETPEEEEKNRYSKFNNEILKTIREIKHSQLNILRDDISSEYCTIGYAALHKLENKMRKLITLFMTTKVGLEWVKASTPQSVINSIKNNDARIGESSFNNFLSETDFIQLSYFLFNKYSPLSEGDVHRELKKEVIDIEKIKEFIPRSNWERYFSELINTQEDKIVKMWGRLYELRNKIAHNRFVSFEEYRMLISNKDKMEGVIDDALSKIDKVNISESQKEAIKNTVADTEKSIYLAKTNFRLSGGDISNKLLKKESDKLLHKIKEVMNENISDAEKEQLKKSVSQIKNNLNMMVHESEGTNDLNFFSRILEMKLNEVDNYIRQISAN